MIGVVRFTGLSFLVATLATTAGCATAAGRLSRGHDLHSSARVGSGGARVLVVGPAVLMHVDVDGRDDLALYTVKRKNATDADCAGVPTGERRHLRPGVANLVNLTVAEEQVACIAVEPNARSAKVVWHAVRIDGGSDAGHGRAVALDGQSR